MRVRVSDRPDPELLTRDARATFFLEPRWADALKAAFPALSFRYFLLEENGRTTAFLPVVEVPNGPLREIVSMPFGTHGGPVSTPEVTDEGLGLLHRQFLAMLRSPRVFRFELTTFDPTPQVEADLVRRLGRHLVRSVAPVLNLA